MTGERPTERDEQFVGRLVEDLERILGTGIIVDELDLGDDEAGPAHIRVVCLLDGRSEVLEVDEETRVVAYDRLIRAAAELRLAVASRNMIAPI